MTDDTQDRLEERRGWLREAAANAAELLEREPDRPAAVIAAINLRAALRQSQDIEAAALDVERLMQAWANVAKEYGTGLPSIWFRRAVAREYAALAPKAEEAPR